MFTENFIYPNKNIMYDLILTLGESNVRPIQSSVLFLYVYIYIRVDVSVFVVAPEIVE